MNILILISLALAPVFAIIMFIWFKDKYEKEPFILLIFSFILGLLAIIPTILFELLGSYFVQPTTLINTFLYAFVVIGFTEEFMKFVILRKIFFRKKDFNEPFDGIVYSVMISMGFAALENVLYVFQHGLEVAILRMFTAVPAHACFAIIMGFYVGKAKFSNSKNGLSFLGLFLATIFHGAYDFFLFQNENDLLKILAFVVLGLSIILCIVAIKKMQKRKILKEYLS